MATYNLKFNKDDSVIRHILIGLVADLTKKISYNQVGSDNETVKIEIPFYLSFTGSEDWLYDHFLFDDLMDPDKKKAIGNYEVIPRGVVSISKGITIDSGSLVNKFVRGGYQKLGKDGLMKSFVSQFQMIPVRMNLECKIIADTNLDVFKITEKIIKRLYKNNQFNVDVGFPEDGTYRIASYYKMPEDYEMERPVEFGFNDKKERSVNFTIEILSFIPSFEPGDEQFAGNRMFEFKTTQIITNDVNDNKPDIGGVDSLNVQSNT